MNIEKKIERLAELDRQYKIILGDKQNNINEILTDEIKEKLTSIEDYFASALTKIGNQIVDMEHEIKDAVIANGKSIKGVYTVSYIKGRVSWDTKALDGVAVFYPEIKEFRKAGKPSARIKR
jgi:hypothetical protein